MVVFVTKFDGTKQLFDRKKVVRTCIKASADQKLAEDIATKIEARIYDGIETKKILQMIFRLLRKYKPLARHVICLRKGLSLLKPKPDFERFIQVLLREHNYEVTSNQIIRGKCVEHEVDAVARKNDETYIVEAKHHFNFHARTGLDESRIVRAVLEDVNEGFELRLNNLKIDRAMIITNTKFSGHAKRYAKCKNIALLGWSMPPNNSLQTLIDNKNLHPITCLKGLTKKNTNNLTSIGIVLIKQLVEANPEELSKKTGIPKEKIVTIVKKAKNIHLSNKDLH